MRQLRHTLGLVLLASACARQEPLSKAARPLPPGPAVRVTVGPISLEAPRDWSLSTVTLAGPPGGTVNPDGSQPFQKNVVITMEVLPSDETAESYVSRQVVGLKQAGVDRKEVSREAAQVFGGTPGLLTEQQIKVAQNPAVRQLQLVAIRDRVAYLVIATELDGNSYEQTRDEFRAMLLSLR